MANTSKISIASWNVRSINSAGPYMDKLTSDYGADILCISEHRLYQDELYKLGTIVPNYEVHAKASNDLSSAKMTCQPGHCGVAIMWSKVLSNRIKIIECDSDRICGIEIADAIAGRSLFIINVYLPHQACKIANFQSHVTILCDLIIRCKDIGEVVIIGDTNCHFGADVGERFSGRSTKNAAYLLNAIDMCGLDILDSMYDMCKGPNYTFNVEGVGSSYIDHCFTSSLVTCISSCQILEDCILNTSDHLPLIVVVEITKGVVHESIPQSRVAWKKLSKEQIQDLYTEPLCQIMDGMDGKVSELEDKIHDTDIAVELIDKLIVDIVDAIKKITEKLPHIQYNKKLKPYWSKWLTELCKNKKRVWYKWMIEGKPRDDHPDYVEYKAVKKEFQSEVNKAKKLYELRQIEEINTSNEIDQAYFWKIVSKKKKTQSRIHPIKLKNGTLLTDPVDIRNAWKDYFKKLFAPSENKNFDNDFKTFVEEQIKIFERDSNLLLDDIMGEPFNLGELSGAIKTLKLNKAPGWDNVTAEDIIYGGEKLWCTLLRIYNCITSCEHIPKHFRIGLLVPIPKGTKDRTNQDNHRGLTLITAMAKLYEKCFTARFLSWVKEKKIISDLQGAGKERCSSIQTAWILKEAICSHTETGGTAYVGLLDAKKAFDTVWHDGFFFKLFNFGLRGKAWRIMRKMYHGFICKIKLHGDYSEEFEVLQGLHQGAPFSMAGYCIYNNDLIGEIQQRLYGIKIIDNIINCVAYADDLTVMAKCKNDLQLMFDIAYRFSKKWRFEYNPKKCAVMLFGNTRTEGDIHLGDNIIKETKTEIHLGTGLITSERYELEFMQKRINGCKSTVYGIQSIGSYNTPISPVVASKLYKTVCIPKLCYGVETMDIQGDTLACMEQFHSTCAKEFQGLAKSCANIGSVWTVGWLSIEAMIDIARLLFMWRLLLLPMSCLYKKILVQRIFQLLSKGNNQGPTWNMINTCFKYGLAEEVIESVETGIYVNYEGWKSYIKRIISETHIKRWKVTSKLYKSLSYLQSEHTDDVRSIGWIYFLHKTPDKARQCRSILNLLMNTYRLGKHICRLCDQERDTIEHILFECNYGSDIRNHKWNDVINSCPGALATELNRMNPVERSKCLLNAFRCNYVHEWHEIYISVSDFIFQMYNHYYHAIK